MLLAALTSYWYFRGGAAGELIEIDRASSLTADYLVDINEAAWTEFEPLPGVGETLAKRIVASREANGPFSSVEDLVRVKGISAAAVKRLRPYLQAGER